MGILSTNKKIINLGQGYSAGSGISIDDYVISVTGDTGTTYSAGQNIDIYDDQGQLYISGKDWSEDISNASANAYNTTTAWVVENYDNSSAVDYISGVVDNISSNVNNINSAVDYYSGSIDYISSTVDNKLDTTAWSTISGDYATTSYVDMNDDLTYDRTTAWVDQNYVADSEISDASGVWNDTSDCVQTNSGAWSNGGGTYDVITANSANWNNVSSKLDISSFESYTASVASGDYELSAGVGISLYDDALNEITRIDVTGSFDNEEVNQVVETNSAAWSNNPGDVNVNNYVYNNSAINDAVNGLVSSNSASWNGKLNKLDFDTYSADINGYISRLYDNDTYFSGAIDYLSGNAGKTYTGISPIVVNNTTNEISADSQDITFGEGLDFTNGVLTVTAGGGGTSYTGDAQGALDEVYENSGVWLTAHQPISANEWNSVYETVETNSGSWTGDGTTYTGDAQGALDTIYSISGKIISGTLNSWNFTANNITGMKLGNITIGYNNIYAEVPGYPHRGWKLYQDTLFFGPNWSNTTNENFQRTILDKTGLSSMSGFSNDKKLIWKAILDTDINGTNNTITSINGSAIGGGTSLTGDAQGAVDEVYSNSADWNSNYSTVNTNSASWGGTPLPMSAGEGIDIQIENDTLVISATGGAGNPEVESYVQTNSAKIDDTVSTYQTNSANYLTTADSANFYPMTGNPSGFISEIPTGTMNTSALEYNAVNEISAYNGSAIAQYGAEKQWLQHDDTIVHVANSAQYAFGCNISAIAQLLGIDETVLFSGNTPTLNSTFSIAEPFSAFKKISFQCKAGENAITTYYDTDTIQTKFALKGEWAYNWMNKAYFKCDMVTPTSYSYTANTLETLKHTGTAVSDAIQITQNDTTNITGVWTIIGIGRKA